MQSDRVQYLLADISPSYLTPIDCFALALTNKACYQLVRALRSNKQHASTHARQHQLHLFRSDQHIRTDFSLVKLSSSSSLSLRLPRFSIASGNALMTQGISSAWRQAATTVHAFPCACYESASNAHELEELWSSDQARGYINIGNVLLRALTTAPWIFTTFTDRPWCIRCKTALTDEDENSWQRKPLEMLGDHKLGRREKQALRKRTLLCRSCVNPQNTRAYMTWCSKCFGVPDVFAVARGYWNTRPRTNALEV